MRRHLVTPQEGKAWLFHRGKWIAINDPLSGEELPIFLASGPRRQNLRRFFCGYEITSWTLGPTFLRPDYSGSLVYVYVNEEKRKAQYLILIEADRTSEIIYAQDYPDILEMFRRLAPVIETDILVDIYRRGYDTFSHN